MLLQQHPPCQGRRGGSFEKRGEGSAGRSRHTDACQMATATLPSSSLPLPFHQGAPIIIAATTTTITTPLHATTIYRFRVICPPAMPAAACLLLLPPRYLPPHIDLSLFALPFSSPHTTELGQLTPATIVTIIYHHHAIITPLRRLKAIIAAVRRCHCQAGAARVVGREGQMPAVSHFACWR